MRDTRLPMETASMIDMRFLGMSPRSSTVSESVAMGHLTGIASGAASAELLAWAKAKLARVVAQALLNAIHARGRQP
jgi:hypothetical protein